MEPGSRRQWVSQFASIQLVALRSHYFCRIDGFNESGQNKHIYKRLNELADNSDQWWSENRVTAKGLDKLFGDLESKRAATKAAKYSVPEDERPIPRFQSALRLAIEKLNPVTIKVEMASREMPTPGTPPSQVAGLDACRGVQVRMYFNSNFVEREQFTW